MSSSNNPSEVLVATLADLTSTYVSAQENDSKVDKRKLFIDGNIAVYERRRDLLQTTLREKQKYYGYASYPQSADISQRLGASEAERHTWELVQELRLCEMSDTPDQKTTSGPELTDSARLSHYEIVLNTIESTPIVKRCLGVLTWLERSVSADTVDDLKTYKEEVTYAHGRQSLAQKQDADPDAIHREIAKSTQSGKPLSESVERESVLAPFLHHIWRLVRCGQLNEAVTLCRNSNQHWRAATLAGGELWTETLHRPAREEYLMQMDVNEDSTHGSASVMGNRRHFLWKKLTATYSSNEELVRSPVERAIYGALSGNVKTVYPQCNSWEDFVWCFLKCSVEASLDHSLAGTLISRGWDFENDAKKNLSPDSAFHASADALRVFFDYSASPQANNPGSLVSLLSTFRPGLLKELHNPYHVLQKLFILGEYHLVEYHLAACVVQYIAGSHGFAAYDTFFQYLATQIDFSEEDLNVVQITKDSPLGGGYLNENFLLFALHVYLCMHYPPSGSCKATYSMSPLGKFMLFSFIRFYLIDRNRHEHIAPYCVIFGRLSTFQRVMQSDLAASVYVDFCSSLKDANQIHSMLALAQHYFEPECVMSIVSQVVSRRLSEFGQHGNFDQQLAALAFLDLSDEKFEQFSEAQKLAYLKETLIQYNLLYRFTVQYGSDVMLDNLRKLYHARVTKQGSMWVWLSAQTVAEGKEKNKEEDINIAYAADQLIISSGQVLAEVQQAQMNQEETETLLSMVEHWKLELDKLEFENALQEHRHWQHFGRCLAHQKLWAVNHARKPVAAVGPVDKYQFELKQWTTEDNDNFVTGVREPMLALLNQDDFLCLRHVDERHTKMLGQLSAKVVMLVSFLLLSVTVEMQDQNTLLAIQQIALGKRKQQFLPQDLEALLNEIKRNSI